MPDTEPPSRPAAATRPSLMGTAEAPARAQPSTDAGRMRMLDELEAVVRPRAAERSAAPSNWLIALLVCGVAVGGVFWWSKHRGAEAMAPIAAATARVAAAPTNNAAPTPPAGTASSATAVIETVAAAPRPAAPVDVAVAGEAGAPPVATEPAAAPTVVAHSPARANTAPGRNAKSKSPEPKVTTVTTASGGKWTVTIAAEPAAAAGGADAALPGPASAVTAARPERARASAKGDDADVRLLSALLAHVSRPAPGATLADEDQLTIAQLVKRCDARPAADVRECRRRICEGYWGKAEACPASTARKG